MSMINWDSHGNRFFSSGLDRGVLYLGPKRIGIPWNGLVSVEEKSSEKEDFLYFDGVLESVMIKPGGYEGTIKAFTYPDEFSEYQGFSELEDSTVGLVSKSTKSFSLSYRVFVGNDVKGPESAYQIHILYNLQASLGPINYKTYSTSPSIALFTWDVEAVPEEIEGYSPTAHIIFDSREIEPELMFQLETVLYSGGFYPATVQAAEIVENNETGTSVLSASIIADSGGSAIVNPYVDSGSGPILPPLNTLLEIL